MNRPINTLPRSKESFDLARSWLRTCIMYHPKCQRDIDLSDKFMPSRVMKLDATSGVLRIRLVESLPKPEPYATLSYCWGGDQELKTMRDSIESFKIDMPVHELPATIRDAAEVALQLNIPNIFVDAFCIIQDDPNDMAHQLAQMPTIYSESMVTIAGSRAKSFDQGFLHEREPLPQFFERGEVYQLPFCSPTGEIGSAILLPIHLDSVTEPLEDRAWALQERLLSPRIIDYATHQTFWHCWCVNDVRDGWLEAGFMGRNFQAQVPSLFQKPIKSLAPPKERSPASISSSSLHESELGEILNSWNTVVRIYSARKLSFPADKLPAIAAAAARFAIVLDDQYRCGLWKSYLQYQILWYTDCKDEEQLCSRTAYKAPSWSWAAIDGPVMIEWVSWHSYFTFCLEILECEVRLASDLLPYGAVESGFITAKGRIKPAMLGRRHDFGKKGAQWFLENTTREGHIIESIADVHIDALEPNLQGTWIESIRVTLLEVLTEMESHQPVGLILCEVKPETFRRIGMFNCALGRYIQFSQTDQEKERNRIRVEEGKRLFHDSDRKTLKII